MRLFLVLSYGVVCRVSIKVNDSGVYSGRSLADAIMKAETDPISIRTLEMCSGLFLSSDVKINGDPWSKYLPNLQRFVVDENMSLEGGSLYPFLFWNHDAIEEVTVKTRECTSIGESCFQSSSIVAIRAFVVTAVGKAAFAKSKIANLDLPGLEMVDESAFSHSLLLSFTSPSLVSVHDMAFASCLLLESFTAESLAEIGASSFSECTSLSSVHIPSVVIIKEAAFISCYNLTLASLNAVNISDRAFQDCHKLVDVSLPNVEYVSMLLFSRCDRLRTCVAGKARILADEPFYKCKALKVVNIPLIEEIGQYAFACSGLAEFSSSDKLRIIGLGCFMETELVQLKISELTKIEARLCARCPYLESVDCVNVDVIGMKAFAKCCKLSSLIVSEHLSEIGDGAFMECLALKEMRYKNVSTLGQCALFECVSLTTVEFLEVIEVVDMCFSGCVMLTAVMLPRITIAKSAAFYGCCSLKEMVIPNVLHLDNECFRLCTSLIKVDFPVVDFIGENCFDGCFSLTTFECSAIQATNMSFANCLSLQNLSMPRVELIGSQCFQGCVLLASLHISSLEDCPSHGLAGLPITSMDLPRLKRLREYSFMGCQNLVAVNLSSCMTFEHHAFACVAELSTNTLSIYAPVVKYFGVEAFSRSCLMMIYSPSIEAIDSLAFVGSSAQFSHDLSTLVWLGDSVISEDINWEGKLPVIQLPQLVRAGNHFVVASSGDDSFGIEAPLLEELGDFGFEAWYLQNISLPSLHRCGQQLFCEGCAKLVDFSLPKLEVLNGSLVTSKSPIQRIELQSLTYAGAQGFARMPRLESLVLPNVVCMEYGCCANCTSLSMMIIPKLRYAGAQCFAGCSTLYSMTLQIPSVNESLFSNCDKLAYVSLTNTNSIGLYCFFNCTSLLNVTADDCKSIHQYAFYNCHALQSVRMGNVDTVSNRAFSYCEALGNVTFDKLAVVGDSAFQGSGLRFVGFPEVVTIRSWAFADCKKLEVVQLNKLESLDGDFTFCGCEQLRIFKAMNLLSVPATSAGIFSMCRSLEVVFLATLPARSFNENVFLMTGRPNITVAKKPVVNITLCLPSYKDYDNYEGDCLHAQCEKNEWKHLYGKKPSHYSDVCGEPDQSQVLLVALLSSGSCVVLIAIGAIVVILIKLRRMRRRNDLVEKDLLLTRVVINDFG